MVRGDVSLVSGHSRVISQCISSNQLKLQKRQNRLGMINIWALDFFLLKQGIVLAMCPLGGAVSHQPFSSQQPSSALGPSLHQQIGRIKFLASGQCKWAKNVQNRPKMGNPAQFRTFCIIIDFFVCFFLQFLVLVSPLMLVSLQ